MRGLSASDESDFVVEGNESMLAMLNENMAVVTLSATFIGLITLIGAAVGLMNIMLVSVNERTREIGTRKALGARPSSIRLQFLMESILISQMGGAVGVALGIVMGNVVSVMTGSPFVIPWLWTIGGLVICLGVGVASGYIPANRAAKLDPIEALRYE
ncbi:MAG: FtsX-like permease family protein [Mucinivorans sp.]